MIILGYDNDLQHVVRQTYDKVKMMLITRKSYDNLTVYTIESPPDSVV